MYPKENKCNGKNAIVDYLLEKIFEDLEGVQHVINTNIKESEDGTRKLVLSTYSLEDIHNAINKACDRVKEAQDVNAEEDIEIPSCMKISRPG